MKQIIEELYKLQPQLLGVGYYNALTYLDHLIGLDIIDIPSGTKLETWTVPDEWVAKEAWVKFNGEKIIEYKNDLSLMVYSAPFKGKVTREELKRHLYTNKEQPNAIPYAFSFYEKKWGFCLPYNKIFDGEGKDLLQEGEYEVFVDTEFKPGVMKIGVHTVPGKTDREVLLFAHLDHPYQANDNLSGVACLTDLALRLKDKYEHTIKIIFCPETIGSIGYALTQDISKVDFVIAVDICGNKNDPTIHWSFDTSHRINRIGHMAMMMGDEKSLEVDEKFSMNRFRATIGSDEYFFNDPKVGIPGLLLTRYPYPEYHTSDDTPEIIDEDKIREIQKKIEYIIQIYEQDFIPDKNFKGPLFRTKYGVQSPVKGINYQIDYLLYNIDGKRYLSEIVDSCEMNWQFAYDLMQKLIKDKLIDVKHLRSNIGEGKKPKTTRKKQKAV
jgi:aminopeptidase-like protein